MKAVVRRNSTLVDTDMAEPVPGEGQVLVKTLVCGICGSDLHALHHLDHMVAMTRRAGGNDTIDPASDMVFGHEFSAEILDFGPGCERLLKAGTPVVSMPAAIGPLGSELVGYSNRFPGGFAEQMVLQEALLLPVPNGLDAERAALTEPMAVGEHAVASANITAQSVARTSPIAKEAPVSQRVVQTPQSRLSRFVQMRSKFIRPLPDSRARRSGGRPFRKGSSQGGRRPSPPERR